MHVCGGGLVHAEAFVWRSEGNLGELVLPFYQSEPWESNTGHEAY